MWPYRLEPAGLLCPWDSPRQKYWSGLPCPPPGDRPDPGIKPMSPALQADSLPLSHWGSPFIAYHRHLAGDLQGSNWLSPGWGVTGIMASLGLKVPVVDEWGQVSSCQCVLWLCKVWHVLFTTEDAIKRGDVSWRLERTEGCGFVEM